MPVNLGVRVYKPSIFDLCHDIMGLVLDEVAKCKFNEVMVEFSDPRFHKAAKRLLETNRWDDDSIHPGRLFVSITYPQHSTRYVSSMRRYNHYNGEGINLYGLTVDYSEPSTWFYTPNPNHQYNIKQYTIKDIRDKIVENGFKISKGMRRKSQWIEFLCSLK